ncbi:MAG: hypothetical protein KGZ80_08525 [Methylomonas sp.]|nr:hypothetical protein [Methylomonas sp.]PPD20390.1 MAG: hypothetical protein CTY23_08930 [Methylomonas sp.]PPD24881.1 MAG: hypothetical protein CTY22_10315 [Methylomonas sp.]PPD33750.1 MAG: hypothetical protein CTY21_10295 [Methylomonas sp.]PPD40541.1 MAG: hypothetical protein CTY17_06045 [Methylomonas sp.]
MSELDASKGDYNFILYAVLAAAVVGGAVYMVKSSEHEKYAASKRAIAEDASNSAYRNDVLHSGGTKR